MKRWRLHCRCRSASIIGGEGWGGGLLSRDVAVRSLTNCGTGIERFGLWLVCTQGDAALVFTTAVSQ